MRPCIDNHLMMIVIKKDKLIELDESTRSEPDEMKKTGNGERNGAS